MSSFSLPWGAWFDDHERRFPMPPGFQIHVCRIQGSTPLDDQSIKRALEAPVESPRLRDIARGRQDGVVVVEDLTRPAKLAEVLPVVLDEIHRGGIPPERLRIIVGCGAHAPLDRTDLQKKLGRWVLSRYDVSNHHAYEDLVDLGRSPRGIPIHVNRRVAEAGLKVAVGSVVPHPYAGFGGGAKIVLPGVAGIETLEANHRPAVTGLTGAFADVENNPARQEMEQIALQVGLDFIVNAVTDDRRRTVGLFAGHPVAAHRAAVKCARAVYTTASPPHAGDIVVLNAYPKDTELLQVGNVFNVLRGAPQMPVRPGGVIVVTAACPKGRGWHSLHGPRMRLYRKPVEKDYLEGRPVVVHTPLLRDTDVRVSFWEGYAIERTWRGVVKRLSGLCGSSAQVVVFPSAPLQLLEA